MIMYRTNRGEGLGLSSKRIFLWGEKDNLGALQGLARLGISKPK